MDEDSNEGGLDDEENEEIITTKREDKLKGLEHLDFSTTISFRAQIEPTNDPVTTYTMMIHTLLD